MWSVSGIFLVGVIVLLVTGESIVNPSYNLNMDRFYNKIEEK
jgi:hypothetical protein